MQALHRAAAVRVLAFHPHFCDAQLQPDSTSNTSNTSSHFGQHRQYQHSHRRGNRRLLSSRTGALGGVTSLAWASPHSSHNHADDNEEQEDEGQQMWLTVGFADGSVRVYDTSEAVKKVDEDKEETNMNSSRAEKEIKEEPEEELKASSSSSAPSSFPSQLPLVAVLRHNDQV